MSLVHRLLEHPVVYRLWQAPFAQQKFRPVRRHNDLHHVSRVLDIGCGPGTNTRYFAEVDYLGLDHNSRYIETAVRRHGKRFITADATTFTAAGSFDFILINSLLHHLDDDSVDAVLSQAARLLTPTGHVHILDLELPSRPSVARLLARLDRGEYPREREHWRRLFERHFSTVILESNSLGLPYLPFWRIVYFKGSRRQR